MSEKEIYEHILQLLFTNFEKRSSRASDFIVFFIVYNLWNTKSKPMETHKWRVRRLIQFIDSYVVSDGSENVIYTKTVSVTVST